LEVDVFFFLSLEMWKEEGGKWLIWGLWKCFFHCEEAREGFSGVNFFYKFIMGRGKGCTGGEGASGEKVHLDFYSYLYNPSITSVMPVAGGCLTRKKNTTVPGCLSVVMWLFLLTLVTFCYFFYWS